jgi:glutathione peroxidase
VSTSPTSPPWDLPLTLLAGRETTLREWKGHALLIVNVASQCGFTPHYEGLEALWRRHRSAGLAVLGFPCDQFGGQEPGSAEEIADFCRENYDVTFPLFAKCEVNGDGAHPLYRWLKAERPGILGTESIKWNFTKFVVDAAGGIRGRYAPTVLPESVEADLLPLLPAPPR